MATELAASYWRECTKTGFSDGFRVNLFPRPGTLRFLSSVFKRLFPYASASKMTQVSKRIMNGLAFLFGFKDIAGTIYKMEPCTKEGVHVEAYNLAAT